MITTLFYEGAVLRNGKGERFMFRYSDKGECADKDVLSFAIASEIAAGRGTEHGGVAFDASGVGLRTAGGGLQRIRKAATARWEWTSPSRRWR